MSLAVYGVVYEAALKFLPEFWRSLAPQLNGGYTLYLSLDEVSPERALDIIGGEVSVNFLPSVPGSTPPSIRADALASFIEAHDGVVLLDCDDVLLPGRLDAARAALRDVDVYGCAMTLVDEHGTRLEGATFSTELPDTDRALGSLLARCNVFGFSNTAYRSKAIVGCLEMDPDVIAMDWLVASRAYLAGATFIFDDTPRMSYRQYDANTAGVLPPFRPSRLLTDARRVADHFGYLLDSPYGMARSAVPFAAARAKAQAFLAWLEAGSDADGDELRESNLAKYHTELSARIYKVYKWWEHVAAVQQESSGRRMEWSPA